MSHQDLAASIELVLASPPDRVFRAIQALDASGLGSVWLTQDPHKETWRWSWKVGDYLESCEAISLGDWVSMSQHPETRMNLAFGRLIHAAPELVVKGFLRLLSECLRTEPCATLAPQEPAS